MLGSRECRERSRISKGRHVFSVIIPTYNRLNTLLECLEGLENLEGAPGIFEVIVVDMGSTDGTWQRLLDLRYRYSLEMLRVDHGGACRARNGGADRAKGEWLVFTGDDVVPEHDWLKKATEHIEFHPELDLLEGLIVDRASRRPLRRFEGGRIPSFPPLNLFVKKTAFERLGGFNQSFDDPELHLQFRGDADLGMRLLDAGGKVALASDVLVLRDGNFTTPGDLFRQMRLHIFDALLYRCHPFRFRQIIEVKNLFGLPVRRLQHIISLVYGTAFAWCLTALLGGRLYEAFSALLAAAVCGLLFRYKYQGLRALQIYRVPETLGFLAAPLVYLWSVVHGAVRYRAPGVLFP